MRYYREEGSIRKGEERDEAGPHSSAMAAQDRIEPESAHSRNLS